MSNVSQIIAEIGQERIADRFGVKPDRIRKCRTAGQFPASWLVGLEDMAGRELPREIFSFKGIATDQGGAS